MTEKSPRRQKLEQSLAEDPNDTFLALWACAAVSPGRGHGGGTRPVTCTDR